jgi:putative spermidine/putrescine transport system permease protein
MKNREVPYLIALILPAFIVFMAFFILPLAKLIAIGGSGPNGAAEYLTVLTTPRYLESLISTVLLSGGVTLVALLVSSISGIFLERNRFSGRGLLISILTFPLAFPGVVIGFLVIMIGGRQGLISVLSKAITGDRWVFAYSMMGLFIGYLYFSIPRVILTIMASAEKFDASLEEAARSLGASRWQVIRDVIIPQLYPALIASGAICFATAMGAFGTAFTLATNIDVLPMVIYTEFTLNANLVTAASLSLILGLVTWIALYISRSFAGSGVAAAG